MKQLVDQNVVTWRASDTCFLRSTSQCHSWRLTDTNHSYMQHPVNLRHIKYKRNLNIISVHRRSNRRQNVAR